MDFSPRVLYTAFSKVKKQTRTEIWAKVTGSLIPFSRSPSRTRTLAQETRSTLAIGIAKSSSSLDKATMAICREELENLGISSKVFSKLKVIGKTLLQLNEKERGEVVKRLPPSYGTIHVPGGLKPQELLTAVKSGVITKTLSIRSATTYVKQIRYPTSLLVMVERRVAGASIRRTSSALSALTAQH